MNARLVWLNRLGPSYRRNFYVNAAITLALIVIVSNLWRLGPHDAPLALLSLVGFGLAYASLYPIFRLARARPRPGIAAFVLAGAYVAAFAYVVVSFFIPLPGAALALLAGVILMWVFFIAYRGIVFPSLFDRGGGFSSRFKEVRAAQRASRAEMMATLQAARDEVAGRRSTSEPVVRDHVSEAPPQ